MDHLLHLMSMAITCQTALKSKSSASFMYKSGRVALAAWGHMQCERGMGCSAEVKLLMLTTALQGCGTHAVSEGTLSVE